MKVDVLVAGVSAAVRPLQKATSTIPIIMAAPVDPVGNGFVMSLAHPGGNTTGLASSADDSAPKQVDLLFTAVPKLSRVGVLVNPLNPSSFAMSARAEAAAKNANLFVISVPARNAEEIESAFATFVSERIQAVIVTADALFFVRREQLARLALRDRIASISPQGEYAKAGGLMSYGESLEEFFRRAASFADKIFKGAKAGDLPIEQPTRFNLTINRRTADALGLAIQPQLYIFADEVIE